jgi:hypothetical protein
LTTIFAHRNGRTEQVTSIDRTWLDPAASVVLWVDIAAPSVPESLILSDTFGFHPLSVEDAMSALQFPKVEPYDGYLYAVLHGLAYNKGDEGFKTHDIDFFLGRTFLVTVHDGTSRSISEIRDHCPRNHNILGDGPVALFHRIVDLMIDRYMPEVDEFEEWMDEIEDQVFSSTRASDVVRDIIDLKRQVSALRRHQLRDGLPVPRRLRPHRPPQRRGDDAAGPYHQRPRSAPVERQQPPQRGNEGADGRLDDLHATHPPGGGLGHERPTAALPGQRGGTVLVGDRSHGDANPRHAHPVAREKVDLRNSSGAARRAK